MIIWILLAVSSGVFIGFILGSIVSGSTNSYDKGCNDGFTDGRRKHLRRVK